MEEELIGLEEKELLACCGSTQFAKEMASASPFPCLDQAVSAARHIWFNLVDVNGWLQAFSAHPQIGQSPSSHPKTDPTFAQWSKGEQSTALATATDSTLQELSDWNARYRNKFGFLFLICASGRTSAEILAELKKRYPNRPIVEFEIAAQEQMKVTELRLEKLFSAKPKAALTGYKHPAVVAKKVEEDRVSIITGHLTAGCEDPTRKTSQIPTRSRPPITTHVLDVSRGSPAAGVEVRLEMWKGMHPRPLFGETDTSGWVSLGSSATDKDGRSGQLMSIVEDLNPGFYRISFNTGKYCPAGFFPYVSIVFEIRESQNQEHFHVPLLLSPFSFSTYRGS
ncbi:hypothetical protein LWI28_012496 [Acer negundo]|uniref:Transthyretin/hydroxyisourate hydrolase domain-containing protein n=1 Tax=Acer negundo TaxID=4023 RepID=A0AAD5NTR9_ACENE|nr:hypothetical protein LWI28_012496 [Acer negundo]